VIRRPGLFHARFVDRNGAKGKTIVRTRLLVGLICLGTAAAGSAQLAPPPAAAGPALPLQAPPLAAAAQTPPTPGTAGGPAPVQASRAPASYVLGPGDRVRTTVFGEDRLSGEYIVTSSGDISFPLIGNIHASGLSVADLQTMIRDKLSAGYLKDPRVTAEVLTFRPFYVLGEVARPGQYPYVDGLTMEQAIATAGGYTYRAKRSKIYLREPQTENEHELDIKKNPLRLVKPGDTIRVGERFF
jgi:protein involved in polysaccharide export with SLBB domain